MKKFLIFLFGITIAYGGDPVLSIPISQKAIDLIIYYEVGGRSLYDKKYTKPIVPAWNTTQSGVTVGFGFDCGYNSPAQIRTALSGIASEDEITLLQSVSGLKGSKAYYQGLPKVKYTVHFTFEEAEHIFKRDSLPRFAKMTSDAFGLSPTRLHPHSNGALVSLVFNRGSSLANTDQRKEMRWIKWNVSIGKEDRVPLDMKSMKRLWSYTTLKGLHLRRDAEAKLFQEGLDARK